MGIKSNIGPIRQDQQMESKLISYIISCSVDSTNMWGENIPGSKLNRVRQYGEYRLRYEAKRSVAQLYQDLKTTPFPKSSNIGIGVESIFGEWLIAQFLGNTVDLQPSLTVRDIGTGKVLDDITTAHDDYLRNELHIREAYEISDRETLTTGNCINKWDWHSVWSQREVPIFILINPLTGQPLLNLNRATGAYEPIPIDPNMPEEMYPTDPNGTKLKAKMVSSVEIENVIQGPRMRPIPIEHIDIPSVANSDDPNDWDYIFHNYTVSAWWFLGREGDPHMGRIPKQKLERLWRAIGVDPNEAWRNPNGALTRPVRIKECHMKFPVTFTGKPVEVIALYAPEKNILLSWRLSPFPRRPFFNRRVWSKTLSPFGKGIPESLIGLRNAADANLNQDTDSGNLYNHPPLLISSLAQSDDEEYDRVGPGTVWTMEDVNGAKFLSPPISKRDPIATLNWIISMMQRQWGVTDLNLNAPSQSLSPNVDTATGTIAVINQGNVKFGHLTKKLEETRTKELKLMHAMFNTMLTSTRTISVDGKPMEVTRAFYKKDVRVSAAGDGIYSNPSVRQKMLTDLATFHSNVQNEFVRKDPEVWFDLTKQLNQAFGLKLDVKDPPALQQLQILQQISAHPIGQQKMKEAMQEIQFVQQQEQAGGGRPAGNPQNNGAPASAGVT